MDCSDPAVGKQVSGLAGQLFGKAVQATGSNRATKRFKLRPRRIQYQSLATSRQASWKLRVAKASNQSAAILNDHPTAECAADECVLA